MSIREDLKAFVDGELTPERAAQVRAAIDADPELRREVTFMKILSKSIQEAAQEPTPSGMEDALRAVSSTQARPWLFARTPLQYVAAAAVVCLLAVVFFPIFAQSKYSAKNSAEVAASKMPATAPPPMVERLDGSVAAGPAGAPAVEGRAMDAEVAKSYRAGEIARDGTVMPEFGPRSIVRTADLSVRVKSAAEAQANATTMAQGLGGFVERSELSALNDSEPVASITLRVPESRFDQAMKSLRALGEVESESVSGQDVTGQIVDVEARLRTLRGEEEQYRQILRSARKIGEVLEVRDRLGQVRQEIEVLSAQRASLKNLAALSTINARFTQRVSLDKADDSTGWADETWAGAVRGLQGVGKFLGQAAITIFVFSPVWLPIALVIWLIARRSKAS